MQILELLSLLPILLIAIVFHEYAHGWTAYRLGDPTAKNQGRLSLNVLDHLDPIGSVILPIGILILNLIGIPMVFIAWAKPVPVNFSNLKYPRRDMMLVAAAGPIMNIGLALIASIFLRANYHSVNWEFWLEYFVLINLILAFFNLLPVPPLDGSRILMGILPNKLGRKVSQLEPYGLILVVVLLHLGIYQAVIAPCVAFMADFFGVRSII